MKRCRVRLDANVSASNCGIQKPVSGGHLARQCGPWAENDKKPVPAVFGQNRELLVRIIWLSVIIGQLLTTGMTGLGVSIVHLASMNARVMDS